MSEDPRYQYQPWHIKLWRLRYRLSVPFWAISGFLMNKGLSFSTCWSIAKGQSDAQMQHWHTWDEIKRKWK